MSLLHAHGIHAEERLHRPWGSNELVLALMVSIEDYSRAFALADSLSPMLGVRFIDHTDAVAITSRRGRCISGRWWCKWTQPASEQGGAEVELAP